LIVLLSEASKDEASEREDASGEESLADESVRTPVSDGLTASRLESAGTKVSDPESVTVDPELEETPASLLITVG
jgi:hypothetical protein